MSNKNIDWNETNNTITINIPLSYRIDKSKIDYVITDSYIKLNIPEMKIFNFIDLNKENDNINIKPIHAEVNIPKDVNLDHNQLPEYNDNNLNRINNQNINEMIDPNQIQIEKFKIPSNLKKTFIVTTILAGLGLILIILGFINEIASSTPGGGIMFWVLGGVVMIPGGYYSYQFFKAYRAKNEYVRNDILENIPVL